MLEPLVGSGGWLSLSAFTVEALDQAEDHLLFAAVTREGESLDEDAPPLVHACPDGGRPLPIGNRPPDLERLTGERRPGIQRSISERNARFFEAEAEKLDGWADDLKVGLEREIKDLDRQIKEARRAATTA